MIPSKLYDVLKYVALIVLPALATLVATLGEAWGLGPDQTAAVVKTITAVATFLGAVLVLTTTAYNKSDARFDGTIDPYYANGVTSDRALSLDAPTKVDPRTSVTLKVVPYNSDDLERSRKENTP